MLTPEPTVSPAASAEAPLSILLTGAGAPGTRGTLYALRHDPKRPVRIIGVDCKSHCAGRYLVDQFQSVPPPEEESYLETIIGICERESARVIIPQTTREVEVLSGERDMLAARGIRVMVSSSRSIQVANNRYRLLLQFRELGLPCPDFFPARSEGELVAAAAALGYPENPVVVKPPVSNGMRGVRVLRECAWDAERFFSEKPDGLEISLDALRAILRRKGDAPAGWELLVTQFLPGPEYTVDCFAGSKAQVAIPRLRRAIRSGITFESSLEPRDDLIQYSLRAACALGLEYAFGFQFKLDRGGVPKILECNPRVQGTMVASVFSGANVIWLALRELLGDAPAEIPAPRLSGCFHRFWGGVGVTGGRVAEI